jgi:hypothetical protein
VALSLYGLKRKDVEYMQSIEYVGVSKQFLYRAAYAGQAPANRVRKM